jgi:hypothetical protein
LSLIWEQKQNDKILVAAIKKRLKLKSLSSIFSSFRRLRVFKIFYMYYLKMPLPAF